MGQNLLRNSIPAFPQDRSVTCIREAVGVGWGAGAAGMGCSSHTGGCARPPALRGTVHIAAKKCTWHTAEMY